MAEGQTMKRLKDKRTKGQTVIYNTLHRKLGIYNGFDKRKIYVVICDTENP